MDISLQSIKKIELVRRVIELEKKGWHCIAPIKAHSTTTKYWLHKEKGLHQNVKRAYNRYGGTDEVTLWKCKMRKVDQ